jgi:hypothetical protein
VIADSKLGVLRWLHTASSPAIEGVEQVTHQKLLRTMDALTISGQNLDANHGYNCGVSKALNDDTELGS